ncbi:MAG: hypothetical protein E6I80_24355 [Chloroflexi bacterium]|nr:MAG: hypothetical protein E6I80_24355 [Chloroflexota bacterium]
MEELQIGINGRVSRRSQGGGKPRLHGWAFRSYIVGLTLAVNLWACGQPVGLRSTCGLAVNLWACGQPGACADSLAVSRIHG